MTLRLKAANGRESHSEGTADAGSQIQFEPTGFSAQALRERGTNKNGAAWDSGRAVSVTG